MYLYHGLHARLSWPTYQTVMSYIPDCHVLHTRLSWPTCQTVMAYMPDCHGLHARLSWSTCQTVMAYMPDCHGLHARLSWPTYQTVMAYMPDCHGLHDRLSWPTCQTVMAYIPDCTTTQNTIISFIFSIHFYFTDIKIYIYLCTLLCVYILLLLSCFGCSQYILLLKIIPSSFYHNHTIHGMILGVLKVRIKVHMRLSDHKLISKYLSNNTFHLLAHVF